MKELLFTVLMALCPGFANAHVVSHILERSVVLHAIVEVKNYEGKVRRGQGGCSGTYITPDEVLTAAHCLDKALPGKIWIRGTDGVSHPAEIVSYNTHVDLGLLRVHGPNHVYARLGRMPRVGDAIRNVGSPLDFEFLVSEGIVAATHRQANPFWATYPITTAMIN